jgi:TonB family protein
MTGRRITKYPNVNDNSQKTGRVVVNIKVDKNGNVIYAEATRRGSTTDDSYLFNLAVKAAYETKLNSSPDMIEQFGTMTFTFRVK